MQKSTLFKTFIKSLESKNISQPLGVKMVKIIIASKSDDEIKRELIKILEESKSEEEIANKLKNNNKVSRFKVD